MKTYNLDKMLNQKSIPYKYVNVGDVIRKRRRELDITQAQLASVCNVSIQTIRNMEQGKTKPFAYVLNQTCKQLDLNYWQTLDLYNSQK